MEVGREERVGREREREMREAETLRTNIYISLNIIITGMKSLFYQYNWVLLCLCHFFSYFFSIFDLHFISSMQPENASLLELSIPACLRHHLRVNDFSTTFYLPTYLK